MDAGFYSLVGIIIGILGTLWVQERLKLEKFKEILYKEKFEAHKNISTALYKAIVEYYNRPERDRRRPCPENSRIAEVFYFEFMRYSDVISKVSFSTIFPMMKVIQEGQPIENLYNIAKEYKKKVRKDLHVEAIDKAIGSTFPFIKLQDIPDKKDED